MREDTYEVAEEQVFAEISAEERVEESSEEMAETIWGDEYFVTEESKSVQVLSSKLNDA